MVIMHPKDPSFVKDRAERRVYEMIRSTFPNGCVCYNDIRWKEPNHDREADFIIFHPNGVIILLEVKGTSRWKRQANKWVHDNGRLPETDPDLQAIANKNSLLAAYRNRNEHYTNSEYSVVCGLVFPEWEPDAPIANPVVPVYHKGTPEDLYQWVERELIVPIIGYVRSPATIERRIGTFKTLSFLECYPKLSTVIESVSDEISKNTLNRLEQTLDEIKEEKCQLVKGLAGCGKTWIAEKLLGVLYENPDVKNIFVTCKNISLATHLTEAHPEYVKSEKCVIRPLYDYAEAVLQEHDHIRPELLPKKRNRKEAHYYWQAILKEFSRRLPSYGLKYDAIIVDEAQMLDPDGWDCIRKMLADDGYFYVFSDQAQRIYKEKDNALPWFNFGSRELKFSIRNTGNIFKFSTAHFRDEKITNSARSDEGIPVWLRYYSDAEDMKSAVVNYGKMLEKQGIDVNDIILLTPKVTNSALYAESDRNTPKDIGGITLVEPVRRMISYPKPKLYRTTIQKFRGRERQVVILAELDGDIAVKDLVDFIYVGGTRAKSHLIVLMNKNVPDEMKELYGQFSVDVTGCEDDYEKIMDGL